MTTSAVDNYVGVGVLGIIHLYNNDVQNLVQCPGANSVDGDPRMSYSCIGARNYPVVINILF